MADDFGIQRGMGGFANALNDYVSFRENKRKQEALAKQQEFENALALRKLALMEAASLQKADKKAAGRPVSVNTAEELGDRLAIPFELQKNLAFVKGDPSLLGPENIALTKIPWMFTGRKDVSSKVGSIRKLAARAIEGARLTDADMDYYRKNLPSETDTPQEFENKTKNLVGLLSRTTAERVRAIGKGGFDISGYESDLQALDELGKQDGWSAPSFTNQPSPEVQPNWAAQRLAARRKALEAQRAVVPDLKR